MIDVMVRYTAQTNIYGNVVFLQIPFSKFYLAGKGRIQDKQEKMQLDKVRYFGISCADDIDGPFQLEIDYIGAIKDENHTEEFAYEMYECDAGAKY